MILKQSFQLVDIAGEYMVIPVGNEATSFNGVIALSDAAFFILNNMQTPKSKEDLLELLTSEYNVDPITAASDLEKLIKNLFEMGVIEE